MIPPAAALIVMLRSLKMHGMAQAVGRTNRTGLSGF